MRGLIACVFSLALLACGQVKDYTDGGAGDDSQHDGGGTIDAKPGSPDAIPFVCDQQACGPSDSCCPSACNANNDPDCAASCNNGILEQGELCDPLSTCPTSCPQIGCQLQTLNNAGTCNAQCALGGQQTACQSGDGCCPSNCNANNDAECAATCGNGVIESGETCDGDCPTSCPQLGCSLYQLVNAGTCQAVCNITGQQGACVNDDGCCPAGCNATNDNDCAPVCGNNVVEPGETCDGNCPACSETFSCFGSTGSAQNCNLVCHIPDQTCGPVDGCCPYIAGDAAAECNRNDDSECVAGWRVMQWGGATGTIAWNPTLLIHIYGIVGGDSIEFTTCTPDGVGQTGDSVITSIVDNTGTNYFPSTVPVNDDTQPGSIPLLAGWSCVNTAGQPYMSTAPGNSGGLKLPVNPNIYRLDVTVAGYGSSSGNGRFFIWWNGTSNPNAG